MTRVKLDIVVFGDTHSEVLRKIKNSLMNYLEIDESFIGDISEYVDMEVEISNADLEDGYDYKATAYCKLKR
jgi:hypothetical protein